MKNENRTNLFWIIGLMAIPFIYLAMIWDNLPQQVPVHFDITGTPDRYGSKMTLIWLPLLMLLPVFLLFRIIPIIDPKQKIAAMGDSFAKLEFLTMALLSALATFLIYAAFNDGETSIQYLYIILGVFFIGLGNYLPTVKPNYFIGIRTPWTLENETVWRKTHRIGGRLFMIGGFFIVLFSLLPSNEMAFAALMAFLTVIVLCLVLYSYLEFKKL